MGIYQAIGQSLLLTGFGLAVTVNLAPAAANSLQALSPEGSLQVWNPEEVTLKSGTLVAQADTLPNEPPAMLDPMSVLKVGERATDGGNGNLPVATLYSYTIDDQAAATVYVHDLPIISFIASDPEQPSPLDRATDLTSQLNQLAQQSLSDVDLTLHLAEGEATEHYSIQLGSQELIRVDEGVLLSSGKQDHATAALMATNRLRRLLFDASPLPSAPQPPQSEDPASVVDADGDPIATNEGTEGEVTLQAQAPATEVVGTEQGYASWYRHPQAYQTLTAAHRTLPFGTRVRVTNMENGAQTVVEINDRGPFIPGRVIDVSIAAAQALRMIQMGVAPVRVEILD